MQSRFRFLRIAALALLVYAPRPVVCRAGCFVCPAAPCIAGGGVCAAQRENLELKGKAQRGRREQGKGWKRLRARLGLVMPGEGYFYFINRLR